jgi:hypothetical protein
MPNRESRPLDIPACPYHTYANKGWHGMGDWLGTGTIAPRLRQYRPFRQARAFARRLKLRNWTEWTAYCKGLMPNKSKRPADIPSNPNKSYAKEGWRGIGDWLGTGTVATSRRQYRPFKQARAFVRRLKLKNQKEWKAYAAGRMSGRAAKPGDIPANPQHQFEKKGWQGLRDWLGNGK